MDNLNLGKDRVGFIKKDCPPLFPGAVFSKAVGYQIFPDRPDFSFDHGLPSFLVKAAPKRKLEFMAGRFCAAEAIRQIDPQFCGCLPQDQDELPSWPSGICGSITHSHGFAQAVCARTSAVLSLGVDAERIIPPKTMQQAANIVLNQTEKLLVNKMPASSALLFSVIFSAKESIYKAIFPILRKSFSFEAVNIYNVDMSKKIFLFELNHELGMHFPQKYVHYGRFALNRGRVHTGVMILPTAHLAS